MTTKSKLEEVNKKIKALEIQIQNIEHRIAYDRFIPTPRVYTQDEVSGPSPKVPCSVCGVIYQPRDSLDTYARTTTKNRFPQYRPASETAVSSSYRACSRACRDKIIK